MRSKYNFSKLKKRKNPYKHKLSQDQQDLKDIASRKDEPTIPFEKACKELLKNKSKSMVLKIGHRKDVYR